MKTNLYVLSFFLFLFSSQLSQALQLKKLGTYTPPQIYTAPAEVQPQKTVATLLELFPSGAGGGRVIQGFTKIGSDNWLVAQDIGVKDENNESYGVVFSLLNKQGRLEKAWKFVDDKRYDLHPATMFVRKLSNKWQLITESNSKKGFTIFVLNEKLTTMDYVKSVNFAKNPASVFAISTSLQIVARQDESGGKNSIVVYKLADFLDGKLVVDTRYPSFDLHAHQSEAALPIQGLEIDDAKKSVYVLSGDYVRSTPKRLYEYSLKTGKYLNGIIPENRYGVIGDLKEDFFYEWGYPNFEPEGLYIESGFIYFTLNSGMKHGTQLHYLVKIPLF